MNNALDVLVVEDSPTQALQLQFLLEAEGYRVTTAKDGIEGLEALNQGDFSIVITDWVMPKMDGIEFCRSLRQQMSDGYIYVFLVTAKSSKEEIVRGLEGGADDYLVKPIEPAELVARLTTAKRILNLEQTLKERNREISRLLNTDHLTKVFNRSYLDSQLTNDIRQSMRYRHWLSVVLCDLDFFKRVNDNYGHQVGDEVLKKFAVTIQESLRFGIDWVARYGGEEFVVVLPETDFAGAEQVCERLRLAVSGFEISDGNGGKISITASFGVAVLPDFGLPEKEVTAFDMVGLADSCLYEAKAAGRNRVVSSLYKGRKER